MAQPVWVLSVDLQTKTATFQSGMADAAKSARGAFTDIKSGAGEMGGHVSTNMFASRHAIMAVSEAFGVQVPRAITAMIAHIGPVGAALEAAFPFAAIALGAILLIEKLGEMHAAGVKLTQDQLNFGTEVQNAFNSLDQKLLQSGIKADELRNDHVGALKKQLELIDRQSMDELIATFGKVAKGADTVFNDLKTHWYNFGDGAEGAKHAMDDFQAKYASLLSQGKDGAATDLLHGTLGSAQKVLAAMTAAQVAAKGIQDKAGSGQDDLAEQVKLEQASVVLRAAGRGFRDNEVKAQQTLVDSLNDQVTVEGKIAALTTQDKSNATASTGKEMAALAAEGARQAAEHRQKMGELMLAAEREQANVELAIHQGSIAARLALDIGLADKEYNVQLQGNRDLQAALDRGGKDYNNQLKGLQNKEAELTLQHSNNIAALRGKATMDSYTKDLADFEEAEREKLEATDHGSAARLAALDAAIKEEQSRNLQATAHYRELLTQRAQTVRQATEEEAKLQAGLGKESAADAEKMGELALAAERESWNLRDSAHRMTVQMRMAEEIEAANRETALKQAALQHEIATLDKGGKDYTLKLKELQDKEKQLTQAHENEITAIKNKAIEEQNQKQQTAMAQLEEMTASGLTEVLMGHKSFASAMDAVGDQIVTGMLKTALMSIMTANMDRERQAAQAARTMFLAGAKMPFPANIVAAPLMGAAAFASMMAFADGGIVPGTGHGDVVPAALTPGEGIIPNSMMDNLNQAAKSGSMGGGSKVEVHLRPVYNLQALDTAGMERVLNTHDKTLQKHFEKTVRKMNIG